MTRGQRAELRILDPAKSPKITPLLIPVPKSRVAVIDCQSLRQVVEQKGWSLDDVRAVLPRRFLVRDLKMILGNSDFWEMKLGQARVLEIIAQRSLRMPQ